MIHLQSSAYIKLLVQLRHKPCADPRRGARAQGAGAHSPPRPPPRVGLCDLGGAFPAPLRFLASASRNIFARLLSCILKSLHTHTHTVFAFKCVKNFEFYR